MSLDYNPALDLYLSVDPGYTNPFAGLWIQPIERNERVLVVREYYQRYRTTPENGKAMLAAHREAGYQVLVGAWGDPSNPERLALLSEVFGVSFQGPRLPVEVGQELVRRWLKVRPDGKPGILIHHRCRNLIRELTRYLKHEPGQGEHHAVDALRYFFDIPRLIRDLRERTGLTQEKFAAKLGVTFPTINRWENGRAKPSPLAWKQIEDLLRNLGERGRDLLDEFFAREE